MEELQMGDVNVRERLKSDLPWLGAGFGIYLSWWFVTKMGVGVDAHAYWLAARGPLYTGAPATYDAYLYSPLFLQMIRPIAVFDWPVFLAIWMSFAALTFAFLLWPLGWRLAVPYWVMCLPEILTGNINWIFALVVAFGLRQPWLWVFPLITKISPAIGPIWFLARREWRQLGISIAATIFVVGVSFAFDPVGWVDWFKFLFTHFGLTDENVGGVFLPPLIRIPVAVVLTFWAALKRRYWVVPLAMALAAPVFSVAALVIFAGLPRLLGHERSQRFIR